MRDADFDIKLLDFDLPEDRIAHAPLAKRDAAKLLVIDRARDTLTDSAVADLPDLLSPGDLLVLNDTRVIPAKFTAFRETGGKIAGLFIRETQTQTWEVMLEGARRCRIGETLKLRRRDGNNVEIELLEKKEAGRWIVRPHENDTAENILNRVGQTPLPPYIRRKSPDPETESNDRARYQTVFAQNPGAVAAPTAGLHFTTELLERFRDRDIHTARVTLHVGISTFKPIDTPNLADHLMHEERFDLPNATADAVRDCRNRGARVVAVGTTALRTLETCAVLEDETKPALVRPAAGTTNLFIYPPRKPRVVDALLTNFHLPRSTLLALVMATAGISRTRNAYQHAVKSNYRFFSYGDAMLIL